MRIDGWRAAPLESEAGRSQFTPAIAALLHLRVRHLLIDHLTTLIYRPIINAASYVIGDPSDSQWPGTHRICTDNRATAIWASNGCPPWAHISRSAPGAFCVGSAGTRSYRGRPSVHITPWRGSHGIAPGTNRGRSPGAGYRRPSTGATDGSPSLCIFYQHSSQGTDR